MAMRIEGITPEAAHRLAGVLSKWYVRASYNDLPVADGVVLGYLIEALRQVEQCPKMPSSVPPKPDQHAGPSLP